MKKYYFYSKKSQKIRELFTVLFLVLNSGCFTFLMETSSILPEGTTSGGISMAGYIGDKTMYSLPMYWGRYGIGARKDIMFWGGVLSNGIELKQGLKKGFSIGIGMDIFYPIINIIFMPKMSFYISDKTGRIEPYTGGKIWFLFPISGGYSVNPVYMLNIGFQYKITSSIYLGIEAFRNFGMERLFGEDYSEPGINFGIILK